MYTEEWRNQKISTCEELESEKCDFFFLQISLPIIKIVAD